MSRVDEPMRRDRLRRPKPNGRIGACPRFPSKNRYQDRGQAERAARRIWEGLPAKERWWLNGGRRSR